MQPQYEETLNLHGVKIPFIKEVITPRIERQMRIGNYEIGECQAAEKFVQSGDRVLDLGGGIGLVSSIVGKIDGVEKVVSFEAHPGLLDVIHETHKINGITNTELRHGLVAQEDGDGANFYLRNDFWGSSMEPDSRPYLSIASVPSFRLDRLVKEIKPNVVISDIEGAELDLVEASDFDGVRTIIIELHPRVYGRQGQDKILKALTDRGFVVDQDHLAGSVWVLHRPSLMADAGPVRALTPAGHDLDADPEVTIVTCMKNEGPFLLEWLAYHRAIGIDNFIVFSNDCADGTDLMLDRLDEMGLVTHLPNPASFAKSSYYQPTALKFAAHMPQVKRSDYVMTIDVDEFVAIRSGQGHFKDLLAVAGPFHALSMSELNFNTSGKWQFEDVWITETFRDHETPEPGHWQARRGVKTIIHGASNVRMLQAHRPFLYDGTEDDFVWIDGSGRPLSKEFTYSNPQNGIDRRGAYDLVCLNHYPLRSVESFLLKMDRGRVAVPGNISGEHYFRVRSLGGKKHGWIDPMLPAARQEWYGIIKDDMLTDLHAEAVRWHEDRIPEIIKIPAIAELRDLIQEKYVPQGT